MYTDRSHESVEHERRDSEYVGTKFRLDVLEK